MAKTPLKLSDQLRRAVIECGKTRYQVAKATGIGEAALSRFVHGERGLSLESLDKLAEHLHLQITIRKPEKRKGK